MEHVVIRRLEHMTGNAAAPRLSYAVETRASAGPAHKHGAFPDDVVWVKLHGGLMVAKAKVKICWIGSYSSVQEIRDRTRGSQLYQQAAFWSGRPKAGYAAVAELIHERWIEPVWAGPRTYGYEWVVLETEAKRRSWLEGKPPPRNGEELLKTFGRWRSELQ